MLSKISLCATLLLSLTACEQDVNPEAQESGPDLGFEDSRRNVNSAASNLSTTEDLEINLFAAEPMVVNPTNMDIDEKGRVWVLEARNYRPDYNPHHPKQKAGDTVVILEDSDKDGVADLRKVFYQGNDINAALGILVLGNQVVVSSDPNIILLTDDDGDDKADRKEYLFTGASGIQNDHGLHALSFGPDGRFYFNAGNGVKQLMTKEGEPLQDKWGKEVDISKGFYKQGMAFRTNLDGSEFEVLGNNFRNNFELAVDAFGTVWQSDNDDDGNYAVRINYVMEYGNFGYQDEITGEGWRVKRPGMSRDIPSQHWHLNDPGVVPNLLQTGAGSPTGMLVYEGRLLPERYWDEMMHADAGPNVVRSYPVQDQGAGYTAEMEDLVWSDDDQWFRPSDLSVSPDGSLFIADWYDATVGGNQAVDNDRGRIFRLAPSRVAFSVPIFDLESIQGLLDAFLSANHSRRYLAYQRLLEMDKEAIPILMSIWEGSDNQRHRARAIWLLGRLDLDHVDLALNDSDPDLRVVGLRMGRQLGFDRSKLLGQLVNDPSAKVRREVAIGLRNTDVPEKAELWTELAQKHDGKDRWYLEALGIGAGEDWDEVMEEWFEGLEPDDLSTLANQDIIWRSRAKMTPDLLASIIIESPTAENLRYFRSFDFLPNEYKTRELVTKLLAAEIDDQTNLLVLQQFEGIVPKRDQMIQAALRRGLSASEGSADHLNLLQQYGERADREVLHSMAFENGKAPYSTQAAGLFLEQFGNQVFLDRLNQDSTASETVSLLDDISSKESFDLLLSVMRDEKLGLPTRRQATIAYAGSAEGEREVLDMVKDGLLAEELVESAASVLLNAWPLDVRMGAEEVFQVSTSELPPIRSLLTIAGNASKGRDLFSSLCSSCHMVEGNGVSFGPDLSLIGDKLSKTGIYEAILHPDAGITYGYEAVQITDKKGQRYLGYVSSESRNELELIAVGGKKVKLEVAGIQSREESTRSLMPSLAAGMKRQDIANLVAYLEGLESEN